MFELTDLTFKTILQIDRLIMDQTVCCLTGPSGCGKSTLLRMLNKLETPDSGRVLYQGEDLAGIEAVAHRRQVTMLPQIPIIYEGTVRDNLLIGLTMQHRHKPTDDELTQVMKRVYLQLDLSADVKRLSGGEKQRLCLARILLLDSPVLLLDEPSAALDPANQDRIIDDVVQHVREHNKQLIMVTHAVELAKRHADQLIRMKGGRIHE